MRASAYAVVCSEAGGQLGRVGFLLPLCVCGARTHVARLGGKLFNRLSHLAGRPINQIFNKPLTSFTTYKFEF